VFWEHNVEEITLLNQFNLLLPEGRREVLDYLRYTLFKQYQRELHAAVFSSQPLYNALVYIAKMCEREEASVEDILAKVRQVKFIFYQQYEKVHLKYASILSELHIEDTLRDVGRLGFENIFQAAHSNRPNLIKKEVEELLEMFRKLANRKDRRRIMAV